MEETMKLMCAGFRDTIKPPGNRATAEKRKGYERTEPGISPVGFGRAKIADTV
jgi:hypothetical protein